MSESSAKKKQPSPDESQPPPANGDSVTSKLDLWSHVGLGVTLLAGFLVILRLLAVSEWNQQTAMAILQQTGSAGILLGALLSILPAVIGMSLVLVGSAVPYQMARDRKKKPTSRQGYQFVMALLVMVLVAPVWNLMFLGLGLVVGPLLGKQDRSLPTTGLNSNWRLVLGLVVVPQAFTLLTGSAPWIPREVVTFKDAATAQVVGYVLKSDSDRLALLEDAPRSVRYIQASTVKSRVICGERSWLGTPVLSLLSTKTPYADCPDTSKPRPGVPLPSTPSTSSGPSTPSTIPGPSTPAVSGRPSATPSS